MVGSHTERIDHPRLDVRYWGGNSCKKYIAEGNINLLEFLRKIRKEGVTSLMVEGGPTLLASFINEGLYDEIRVETSPKLLFDGLKSPRIPEDVKLVGNEACRDNIIELYRR